MGNLVVTSASSGGFMPSHARPRTRSGWESLSTGASRNLSPGVPAAASATPVAWVGASPRKRRPAGIENSFAGFLSPPPVPGSIRICIEVVALVEHVEPEGEDRP